MHEAAMRFLIANTDYPAFLEDMYRGNHLAAMPYNDQLQVRRENLFGVSAYYADALNRLGHPSMEVYINNKHMQQRWLRERGKTSIFWRDAALLDQIRYWRPDVLLVHAMETVSDKFIRKVRGEVPLIVGQIASPLPATDLHAYDMIISSLPGFVKYFRSIGIQSQLNGLAFESRIAGMFPRTDDVDASFVGSFTSAHGARDELIETLTRDTPLRVWGRVTTTPPDMHGRYQGEAWGRDMYEILARSKVAVNQHIGVAGEYANNLRLYEATGMGAMLLTDVKTNLAEIFEPGVECVAYDGPDACARLIKYYLAHDDERRKIAEAGQRRTLREYNYDERCKQLVEIIDSAHGRHI